MRCSLSDPRQDGQLEPVCRERLSTMRFHSYRPAEGLIPKTYDSKGMHGVGHLVPPGK